MRTVERPELVRYLAELPDRTHGAIIYNDDEVRYPLMVEYLAAGLERNYLCIVATMDASPEPVRKRTAEFGLDASQHEPSLHIRTRRMLFGPGKEPDLVLRTWNIDRCFAEARRLHKVGIRWAGELPNRFMVPGQLGTWFRREEAFNERAPNYSVVCAHDSRLTLDRSVVDAVHHY
jgi:hypothetical protein